MRTRAVTPAGVLPQGYERVHPPVLLVFHQVRKRSAKKQMAKVADLTRPHRQGRRYSEGGYHSYDNRIPIVATTLELLREHGRPASRSGAWAARDASRCWTRSATRAGPTALALRRQAAQEEQQRRDEREAAQREMRRPGCTSCGHKFTDERWTVVDARDWNRSRESHAHLHRRTRGSGSGDRLGYPEGRASAAL